MSIGLPHQAGAIDIVLDYTLDEMNFNWFGGTPEGLARRATVDAAAGFLSEIITNDDWNGLSSLNESFSLTDISASSINGIDGSAINGSAESDGEGFAYTINTTNRSSVAANEYVVYIAALEFDSGTSSHAKAGWDSNDRRNAAGFAGTEFNTWGGKMYFDTGDTWYTGQHPGIDPTDDYGFQDPDKTPTNDIPTDDWLWSESSGVWKGFDLASVDPGASGQLDLYATTIHELIHALGATTSVLADYVGVDANGDFIGENVVDAYGGPVPGAGGHFATNLQSEVWASNGIVSEAVLDPNSQRAVRKYLTEVDAALLRDLGYDVLTSFQTSSLPGDFNLDGIVDAADFTVWRDHLGALDEIALNGNGDGMNGVDLADYDLWRGNYGAMLPSAITPEPSSCMTALIAFSFVYSIRRRSQTRR